jgi:hypothetical protein
MPQISTGMCIGRNTLPASGMEWKAMGSTTHRAIHTAVRVIFFTEFFALMENTLLFSCTYYINKKGSIEAPRGDISPQKNSRCPGSFLKIR